MSDVRIVPEHECIGEQCKMCWVETADGQTKTFPNEVECLVYMRGNHGFVKGNRLHSCCVLVARVPGIVAKID